MNIESLVKDLKRAVEPTDPMTRVQRILDSVILEYVHAIARLDEGIGELNTKLADQTEVVEAIAERPRAKEATMVLIGLANQLGTVMPLLADSGYISEEAYQEGIRVWKEHLGE